MRRISILFKILALVISISEFINISITAYATNTPNTESLIEGGNTTGAPSTVNEQELVPEGSTSDGMQVVTKGLKADPVTNDITYTTVDKQRTSETYYQTIGFTISDAYVDKIGNIVETGLGSIEVFINTPGFNNVEKQQISGTISTTSWTLSYDTILSLVKVQYPQWYAKLTSNPSGESVALKLDAIITFYINGQVTGEKCTKDNLDYYKQKYSWFSKYSDNHFNKGLVKYYAKMVEEGKITEEEAQKMLEGTRIIGKDEPDYWTFNWNPKGQFDLGDAIPTSEDVRNGYQADQWFGYAVVNKREGAEHKWGFGGTITYTESYEYTDYDSTGKPYQAFYEYSVTENHSYTVERSVGYWFMTSAAFWDLDTVKDENTVYPSGAHNFTSKIDVPMACTINGVDLTTSVNYDSTPNDDYHVNWGGAVLVDDFTIHTSGKSRADAEEAFAAIAESRIKESDKIEVRNDQLTINGKTYMTSGWREFQNWRDAHDVGEPYAYSEIGGGDYGIDRQDTGETGDAERIPSTIKNKEYTTTITVNYKQKITPSGATYRSKSGKGAILSESVPTGIGKDFPSQEPIRVHTPVISPVTILDPDTGSKLDINTVAAYKKTQVVDGSVTGYGDNYNEDADYQLLLDGKYTIKFDMTKHMEHLGYSSAANNDGLSTEIYNKYTKRRYVCFPFIVQVDGKIYYPDDTTGPATDDKPAKEEGYTDWIEVYKDDGDGHDQDTVDFYVPTWAIEGFDYVIQYMVVPENATKEDFDTYRQENLKNVSQPAIVGDGHLYNYMATYSMEVQLSGWIYDFQAVGVNEKDIFNGYTVTPSGNQIASGMSDGIQNFAFCPTYQEKKQGNKNRIGGSYVRYTFDGSLTNNWLSANTLPFSNGTSLAYKNSGVLRKGDQFAFTVRTIANLWDESGDEMIIVPTFRYISYDGSVVDDDINVYYQKVTDTNAYEFVKYGSEQDLSFYNTTSIADTKFRGSFYQVDASLERTLHSLQQDDADFSTKIANRLLYELNYPINHSWPHEVYKGTQVYLSKKVPCNTLSSIRLTNELRLLTGNLEQLEQNLDKQGSAQLTYVKTKDENGVSYDITPTSEPEVWEDFRKSMQTWFGTYYIPSKLYVTSKDVDVWEYASEHGSITGKEDIFYDTGYLVLNFDIYTKNNGNWHLKYYGTNDGKNQWDVQGSKNVAKVGDPVTGREITVQLRPGDVAIIDMGQSKLDDYDTGIYINN